VPKIEKWTRNNEFRMILDAQELGNYFTNKAETLQPKLVLIVENLLFDRNYLGYCTILYHSFKYWLKPLFHVFLHSVLC
jgi:hypothetical protein